jgi:hypothetical protein
MVRLINLLSAVLQEREPIPGPIQKVLDFIDSPAPYSPFSEYLLVLFVLWLLARRDYRRKNFDAMAQEVLDQKLASGEIDKRTYDKYRQEMTIRPKR